MKIIQPSFELLTPINGNDVLKHIELCGRVCYKSEDKITEESAEAFVRGIIKNGHESVLEHYNISVRIICDRGVSHEIVRHRVASYSQESTRYANYSFDKFDNQITVIAPIFNNLNRRQYAAWLKSCETSEKSYFEILNSRGTPQEARAVLPNSLKTELIMTTNLREWRHFFKLRTSSKSHPSMRGITIPMLKEFKNLIPVVFDDIEVVE